jgi:hypothetical protein
MYRDADNYKAHTAIVLQGRITVADANQIVKGLYEGEAFIPGQIGLPDLQGSLTQWDGWNEETDHPFHDITRISYVNDEVTMTNLTASELVKRLSTTDWNHNYLPDVAK